MKPVPHGEPYAGKLHVRFDEGVGVPDEGRPALLYCCEFDSVRVENAESGGLSPLVLVVHAGGIATRRARPIRRRARMESQRVGRGRRPRRPATAIKRNRVVGRVRAAEDVRPYRGGYRGSLGQRHRVFLSKKLRCTLAQMLRCRGRSRPRQRC